MLITERKYNFRSAEEAKTHELLDTYRDHEWSQEKAILAMVFKACWSQSLTVKRVNITACALACLENCDLQDALTAACRAKVLRSRMSSGRRLYEVNY